MIKVTAIDFLHAVADANVLGAAARRSQAVLLPPCAQADDGCWVVRTIGVVLGNVISLRRRSLQWNQFCNEFIVKRKKMKKFLANSNSLDEKKIILKKEKQKQTAKKKNTTQSIH